MQATHGPGFRGRGRGRLLGWLIGLAALSAMIMPTAASAVFTPPPTEAYLALGDSLAFGFSTQKYHEGEVRGFEDPELFEHGYPNFYLKSLQAKDLKLNKEKGEKKYVKLINDGCPKETSGSLIGTNATLIGTLNAATEHARKVGEPNELPPIKGASPCAYQSKWETTKTVCVLPEECGPLHHPYPHSQLEDALNTIAVAKKLEHKPVTTISLDIGPNDEKAVVSKVEGEAKTFGGQYFVNHKTELEKEGGEEAQRQYEKHETKYNTEGGEAAFKKCSEIAFAENGNSFAEPEFENKRKACLAAHGNQFAGEAIHEKLEAYAKKAVEFKVGAVAEAKGAELLKEQILPVFLQLQSNILGTLVAIRDAGSLHLEGEGGEKYIDYPTGKIIFQGQYNPFGKQFNFAFEGVQFVQKRQKEAFEKCSAKAFVENGNSEAEPEFAKKREACIKASGVAAYAIDSGRCGEHATELEFEEEAIEKGCIAAALQPGFNALQGIVNLLDHETVAGLGSCYTDPQLRFNPQKGTFEPERLKKWTRMTNATLTEVEGVIKFNGPDIHATGGGYKELAEEMVKEETETCHKEHLPGF